MRVLLVVAVAACGSRAAAPAPALVASSARLPAPAAIDPGVRGAAYLTAVAAQLEPRWAAFLEDCRLRLPAVHPLNRMTLAATFELAVARDGKIVDRAQLGRSGNGDFDSAVAEVLTDASPLPAPPPELESDDELVHLHWLFARDRRQAGPATAQVVRVELPLAGAIERLLGRGDLAPAARRIAAASAASPERDAAARRVMIAALREALGAPDSAARRVAAEACGRARVAELAGAVRTLIAGTSDPEVRRAAIAAAGALGDPAAAPALLAALRDDLVYDPRTARARIEALVAVGRRDAAAGAVRGALDAAPNPTALAALGLVPDPALAIRIDAWSAASDPAIRAAVCAALPAAAPERASAVIQRGLRDPDATVRAVCAEAAGRAERADPALVRRLRELVRDRDQVVRARAVAAVGALDPAHPVRAVEDPAPEVRAAAAAVAAPTEQLALLGDPTAEVRAAALAALGVRAGAAAVRAASDPSELVRCAAAAVIDDPGTLARLAGDDSPEVATAALIRLTALHGRAAATSQLLDRLAAAPRASPERARIALAWLLAP